MLYIIIGCLIIIGFLGYKLYQKLIIDKNELEKYHNQLIDTKAEKKLLDEQIDYEKYKLEECKKDLQSVLDVYLDITDNKLKEIDTSIEELRQRRQEDLDKLFYEKKAKYELLLLNVMADCEERELLIREQTISNIQASEEQRLEYLRLCQVELTRYESLLEPIKLYEKEKQERLFYTILLPEEFRDDIEFLLTTVAAKVQHPDIISKLVWAEYVKPNLDNTFKRIEIQSAPGIYKLTSLTNGMSYIGKSTDVKKRIADHFKSSIGIKSIADLAVHHAILKEGFWNWTIEVIVYADKDKLNELEKYYIEFFKTQEFGYNKNSGGGG